MAARLLILGWLTLAWVDAATVTEKLTSIPNGAAVKVTLRSGEKLKGRLGAITGEQFELQVATNGTVQARTLRIADLKSIGQTGRMHPATVVLITIGVLYGIGIAIGLALGD